MKTKILSKDGRIFLIYRGEDYGSYPACLISVERKAEKSLVVRLGVSVLFAEVIENTLIDDEQLTHDNFEELTKGIDGDVMTSADKVKLDTIAAYIASSSDLSQLIRYNGRTANSFMLAFDSVDTRSGDVKHNNLIYLPTATNEYCGILSASDKAKLVSIRRSTCCKSVRIRFYLHLKKDVL